MFQMQIAVTISDLMIRNSFPEKSFLFNQKFSHVVFDEVVLIFGDGNIYIIYSFSEIFLVIVTDIFNVSHFVNMAARLSLLMKSGDFFSQIIHYFFVDQPFDKQCFKHSIPWKLLHPYGIINNFDSIAESNISLSIPRYGHNIQICVRGKAPI